MTSHMGSLRFRREVKWRIIRTKDKIGSWPSSPPLKWIDENKSFVMAERDQVTKLNAAGSLSEKRRGRCVVNNCCIAATCGTWICHKATSRWAKIDVSTNNPKLEDKFRVKVWRFLSDWAKLLDTVVNPASRHCITNTIGFPCKSSVRWENGDDIKLIFAANLGDFNAIKIQYSAFSHVLCCVIDTYAWQQITLTCRIHCQV